MHNSIHLKKPISMKLDVLYIYIYELLKRKNQKIRINSSYLDKFCLKFIDCAITFYMHIIMNKQL